eukprot:COSAG02_NODE_44001_length_370_cov_0.420664_2_plen_53_part_01
MYNSTSTVLLKWYYLKVRAAMDCVEERAFCGSERTRGRGGQQGQGSRTECSGA